jgi:hypothetical protein
MQVHERRHVLAIPRSYLAASIRALPRQARNSTLQRYLA